jgi:hypothetical protein
MLPKAVTRGPFRPEIPLNDPLSSRHYNVLRIRSQSTKLVKKLDLLVFRPKTSMDICSARQVDFQYSLCLVVPYRSLHKILICCYLKFYYGNAHMFNINSLLKHKLKLFCF